MTANEAIELCKAGTDVRREAWHHETLMRFVEGELKLVRPGFELINWNPVNTNDEYEEDWVVFEPTLPVAL